MKYHEPHFDKYITENNNSSGFLEEFPKSKFTRLEIGKP